MPVMNFLGVGLSFLPIQHPLTPTVDHREEKHGEEQDHRVKRYRVAGRLLFHEYNSPREQEHSFHIEDEKQYGEDVEADVDVGPGERSGRDAAFVRGEFLGGTPARRQQLGPGEHRADSRQSDEDGDDDGDPIDRVHGRVEYLQDGDSHVVSRLLHIEGRPERNHRSNGQIECQINPRFESRWKKHRP